MCNKDKDIESQIRKCDKIQYIFTHRDWLLIMLLDLLTLHHSNTRSKLNTMDVLLFKDLSRPSFLNLQPPNSANTTEAIVATSSMSHNRQPSTGAPARQLATGYTIPKEVRVPRTRPPLQPSQAHLMSYEDFLQKYAVQAPETTDPGNTHQDIDTKSVLLDVEAIKARHEEFCDRFDSLSDSEKLE